MPLQFKYCGKEINKEDFNKLKDVYKWVTNTTVNSVDFNSVFDGKYKSMRTINDHIKSLGLLPIESSKSDCEKVKKELETILEEEKKQQFSKQVDVIVNLNDKFVNDYLQVHKDKSIVFNDGLFSRINSAEKIKKEDLNFTTLENQKLTDKEQNHLSTRHKSQQGETHNEKETSLELKNKIINNNNLQLDLSEICNILLFKDKENIYNRLKSKNSAKEIKTEKKDSVINKEKLQSYNLYDNPNYLTHLGKELEGVKHNQHKLPMSKLFIQFPDALQAVVLASCYGHHCYATDIDWLNFKRVEGGSENYKDASLRHLLGGEKDKESNLPEVFHQAWNKLAELQLWLEENNIDIKEFSNNYLKNLQDKK